MSINTSRQNSRNEELGTRRRESSATPAAIYTRSTSITGGQDENRYSAQYRQRSATSTSTDMRPRLKSAMAGDNPRPGLKRQVTIEDPGEGKSVGTPRTSSSADSGGADGLRSRASSVTAGARRVSRQASVASALASPIRGRISRNSVLTPKQVKNDCWRQFVDSCCGSLCQGKDKVDMDELKSEQSSDAHKVPLRTLYRRLNVDPFVGLSSSEVSELINVYGFNRIRPPPTIPEWYKFGKQLVGGFCILLWVAAALCWIAYGVQVSTLDFAPLDNLVVGVVLAAVITISAIFAYFQEAKSAKIMESFTKCLPQYTKVLRDGQEMEIPLDELVPGDIIKIKGGDRVPADCRIIESSSFKVDNSCLTGESEPQARIPECTNDNPLETKNLMFFSTFAVEGTATGIVVSTGDQTVMGRIARLTTGIEQKPTPLSREMTNFVAIISVVSVGLAIIVLVIILPIGISWLVSIIFIIALFVGNVPEGAIIEVTVCLTLAAKRMARRNALVKNLEAVETLGSTSTICSDKTGTLTQNRMTVSHLWLNDKIEDADISSTQKSAKYDKSSPRWQALHRICCLCNRAVFKPGQGETDPMNRECIGDGSESALLKFAEQSFAGSSSVEQYQKAWPKQIEIPFNSATKMQVSVHRTPPGQGIGAGMFHLVMKGAPERIISYCATALTSEGEIEIDDEFKTKFNQAYEEMGGMGERVLGFCDYNLPPHVFPPSYRFSTEPEANFPLTGLRFIGLVSLIDPPRPQVPDAVRRCRLAGIRVIMVTGDHPITAKAIAKAVGILSPGSKTMDELAKERGVPIDQIDKREATAAVIPGYELKDMTPEQLDDVIMTHPEIVFARTSPQQKLLIVEGFQRCGAIVAVTGDGVNDSPALKRADIGIAMGITGSDVSKQAADMVLMDDNFATIVFAVEEGRLLFDNLKKTVCYILASSVTCDVPPIIYIFFGVPNPLGTIPMLIIPLGTDFLPAITFAYESKEADLMERKPRNPKTDKLVGSAMMSVSYGMNGIVLSAGSIFAWLVFFAEVGFLSPQLWYLRDKWESTGVNNLPDSYGQEWTYDQRMKVQYHGYATCFTGIVVMQWMGMVINKTRRMSPFDQGWRNHWQEFGLLFETVVGVICCYVPGFNDVLSMLEVYGLHWLCALPFALFLFAFDCLRKLAIRHTQPGSFAHRELFL